MSEQLDRIEAMLEELLKRTEPKKRTGGAGQAKKHDEAVKAVEPPSDEWMEAWTAWCESRRNNRRYMTDRIVAMALKKLGNWPLPVQIEALNKATISGWTDVYPESVRQEMPVMRPGEDWFNGTEQA